MKKQQTNQHSFKNDRYVKARGGNSRFLDIYCSNCNHYLLLYQKDGKGSLLRLYLDRIFEPPILAKLQFEYKSKSDMQNLKCLNCQKVIAISMVYKPEDRLAFSLIRGTFIKKNMRVSPPAKLILKSKSERNI